MNQEKKLSKCLMIMLRNISRNIYEKKQGKELKILTPKQMLQRLPLALAQINAGNNSEN